MTDTSVQERKSSESSPLAKLCRMLRSMLRRYPQACLLSTSGGFGVSLDASNFMLVSYSGRWSEADMRDCLALFATWCVADPQRLMRGGEPLVGVLRRAQAESDLSSGQQVSNGT